MQTWLHLQSFVNGRLNQLKGHGLGPTSFRVCGAVVQRRRPGSRPKAPRIRTTSAPQAEDGHVLIDTPLIDLDRKSPQPYRPVVVA